MGLNPVRENYHVQPGILTSNFIASRAQTRNFLPFLSKIDPMKPFLPILIVLISCFACNQHKSDNHEKEIDDLVSAMVKPGSAGVTIAVAEGDKILFSKGYGSANPEYDIPNSPSTIFHVASVSKQFTAFAIALLHDQGKISLDDDIRKYIPELPDFGHKITIKQLAHHTSGLR